MSEEIHQGSVQCPVLEKYNPGKDTAAHSEEEFDKKYSPTWHWLVARNFGSYVTHETKHFFCSTRARWLFFFQIWLKAWTQPQNQWSTQTKNCSLNSKHQRLPRRRNSSDPCGVWYRAFCALIVVIKCLTSNSLHSYFSSPCFFSQFIPLKE